MKQRTWTVTLSAGTTRTLTFKWHIGAPPGQGPATRSRSACSSPAGRGSCAGTTRRRPSGSDSRSLFARTAAGQRLAAVFVARVISAARPTGSPVVVVAGGAWMAAAGRPERDASPRASGRPRGSRRRSRHRSPRSSARTPDRIEVVDAGRPAAGPAFDDGERRHAARRGQRDADRHRARDSGDQAGEHAVQRPESRHPSGRRRAGERAGPRASRRSARTRTRPGTRPSSGSTRRTRLARLRTGGRHDGDPGAGDDTRPRAPSARAARACR